MVWAKAVRRPIDSLAMFTAFAASLTIVVNALFLQSGPHPSPFSINPAPLSSAVDEVPPKPVQLTSAQSPAPLGATHNVEVTRTTPPVPSRRNDPIAQLIGQTSQIVAVQRALSQYGYGQIKLTGVVDVPTSAAIEEFERAHNLPVTGKISDALLSGLATEIGHSVR
jgi:peptidoglycan hydrolase-like protein with peptidoglycan-binding domain